MIKNEPGTRFNHTKVLKFICVIFYYDDDDDIANKTFIFILLLLRLEREENQYLWILMPLCPIGNYNVAARNSWMALSPFPFVKIRSSAPHAEGNKVGSIGAPTHSVSGNNPALIMSST